MKKSVVFVVAFHAALASATGQTYVFTTLAGAPSEGSMNGPANAALFRTPRDIAIDASGNLYIADTSNHTIRRITPAGLVSTLAGAAGQPGSAVKNNLSL